MTLLSLQTISVCLIIKHKGFVLIIYNFHQFNDVILYRQHILIKDNSYLKYLLPLYVVHFLDVNKYEFH